ncbi:MAG: sugar ABC transporter substrate-binding protein [bacterium]|nr:sugar ABC transporter substrate-binding protein [bacterium]
MLKKLIILLLLPLLLCGCTKTKQEEISFASWGSVTEVGILHNIIDNFEKENPDIKVNFIHIPQNYFQKLHLLFASNTEPDIIFINNLYLPIYSSRLMDLTGIVNTKDFYPQAINGMKIDGKLYAIPRDLSYLVLYVNTDMINLPQNNWTLDNLLQIAQKSTTQKVFGLGCENNIYYALPYLEYFGGGIFDIDKKLVINSKESIQGIDYYKNLKNKYKVCPTKSQIGSLTLAQMFINKQIGMYLSGRWMYPKISETADFSWAVINFPYGKKPLSCDTSGWAISKNTKHKNSALKFVKFLAEEKNSEYFTKTGLIVPANIKASKGLNNTTHNEKVFIDIIKHTQTPVINKDYKKLTDKINSELDL